MSQRLSQEQVLENVQIQKQSPIKVLQAKILELSITELEERVQAEMDANPALEGAAEESHEEETEHEDFREETTAEDSDEKEERQSALMDALQSICSDDEPSYNGYKEDNEAAPVFGSSTSFMDELMAQVSELDTTEHEDEILEYLIGSLDANGMLPTATDIIVDELEIHQNIETTEEEVEHCRKLLKSLEPAGIGAKDLQECLLLQIERKEEDSDGNVPTYLKLMRTVITEHFDQFKLKHCDKIQKALGINDVQVQYVFAELKKLNPRPGASINESSAVGLMQITPDFIVDTTEEGRVSFRINKGHMPDLVISDSYKGVLESRGTSKAMREAVEFAKNQITSATNFIDAIKQRNQTLYIVMKALVEYQLQYFRTGEEGSIKSMILRTLAERTGLDESTISRSTNGRYVETRWGTFPLKKFFSEAYKTQDGEELSTIEIRDALKSIIESEDKKKPYSDEKLTKLLAQQGYPIARRTVAKYREMMKIPVARLRK